MKGGTEPTSVPAERGHFVNTGSLSAHHPEVSAFARNRCPQSSVSALRAQYYRLKARRGAKRAALAVAHSILVAIYYMLRDGTSYKDLGADFFDKLSADRMARYHTKRLQDLGYDVNVTKAA